MISLATLIASGFAIHAILAGVFLGIPFPQSIYHTLALLFNFFGIMRLPAPLLWMLLLAVQVGYLAAKYL